MGVSIEGNIDVYLKKKTELIVQEFVRDLMILGERCVAYVRDRTAEESWMDQTGNLRSSIGYVVCKDGQVISASDFKQVKEGGEGSMNGQSYAESLAHNFPEGYALIVVAGMDYAAYVENLETKDVLASGELFLKEKLNEIMEDYNNL